MQRREFIREPSRSARWALPPALQSVVLAVLATISHWLDWLATPNFVLVLVVAFVLALVGFLLSVAGLTALWKRAAIGGKRSFLAMAFSMPMLGLGMATLVLSQTTARISDVSTDPLDPPHFRIINETWGIINPLEPPRIDPALQSVYPELSGRRYALSPELVASQVVALVKAKGWTPATTLPMREGTNDWLVEAVVRTGVFGFRDAVIIRATDEGESTYLDMRSASGFGEADLGANARRIAKFMTDLDLQISLSSAITR